MCVNAPPKQQTTPNIKTSATHHITDVIVVIDIIKVVCLHGLSTMKTKRRARGGENGQAKRYRVGEEEMGMGERKG